MHGILPPIRTPSRSIVATFRGLFVMSWMDWIPISSRMLITAVYSLVSSGNPMRVASTVSSPCVSCSAYAAILFARPIPRPPGAGR